jgi:hypothetical protein
LAVRGQIAIRQQHVTKVVDYPRHGPCRERPTVVAGFTLSGDPSGSEGQRRVDFHARPLLGGPIGVPGVRHRRRDFWFIGWGGRRRTALALAK